MVSVTNSVNGNSYIQLGGPVTCLILPSSTHPICLMSADGGHELPKFRLKPGMRVRVVSGPLCEQTGLLVALRPHERVLVLLQLLGGQQRVELAQDSVEAAS